MMCYSLLQQRSTPTGLLLMVALFAAACTAQLVANADFELPNGASVDDIVTTPDAWNVTVSASFSIVGTTNGNGTVPILPVHGRYCWVELQNGTVVLDQTLQQLQVGAVYAVSLYVSALLGSDSTLALVVGLDGVTGLELQPPRDNTWNLYSGFVTAQRANAVLSITVIGDSGATVALDEVDLSLVPPTPVPTALPTRNPTNVPTKVPVATVAATRAPVTPRPAPSYPLACQSAISTCGNLTVAPGGDCVMFARAVSECINASLCTTVEPYLLELLNPRIAATCDPKGSLVSLCTTGAAQLCKFYHDGVVPDLVATSSASAVVMVRAGLLAVVFAIMVNLL